MARFGQVAVTADPSGSRAITWHMDDPAGLPDPADFYVDRARTGGDWTLLAGPLANTCLCVDPERRDWNKDRNTYYRIRIKVDGEWMYSTPEQALGEWSRSDYILAREICRKEYLLMRKAGEEGLLLKRREWGPRCSCVDADTKEIPDARCTKCLGTGIRGGYYAGIPLPVLGTEPSGSVRSLGEAGLAHGEERSVRAVAYPLIVTDDVWVGRRSDERWRIRAIKTVAEVRRIPLVQMLQLQLLPQSDLMYSEQAAALALSQPPRPASGTGNAYGWKEAGVADCLNRFDY